jgi:hypothetical protein
MVDSAAAYVQLLVFLFHWRAALLHYTRRQFTQHTSQLSGQQQNDALEMRHSTGCDCTSLYCVLPISEFGLCQNG